MSGIVGRRAISGLGVAALIAGCTPPDGADRPDGAGRPDRPGPTCATGGSLSVEVPQAVLLARRVRVELEVPAVAELVVDGVAVARSPAARVHELPVHGRPGSLPEVRVRLTCDRPGGELGPIEVDLGDPPAPWPEVEVLADRPDLREPGLTLLDVGEPGAIDWVAALEPDGTPVWAWRSGSGKVLGASLEPDGTVWVLTEEEIVRLDLLGEVLGRWRGVTDDDGSGATLVEGVNLFHHEVVPTSGGFVALDQARTPVGQYPMSELQPYGPMAPAELVDPVVVEVAADGALLARYPLLERLDPQRIGWLSLQEDPYGHDWGHANGIAIDPVDGGLVVSLRHQDAIVKLDRATGEVRWILANPDGWRSPWAELRLTPAGEVSWPYHQHAPMVTVDEDGTREVLVFDNGNFDRTTPYSGVDDGEGYYSRMVAYRVDEQAGTVAEAWSVDETTTGRLFSGAFGNADRLPGTGNRLATFGMLFAEGEVRNVDRGRGTKSVRLVEAAPDGTVVWEVSMWGRGEEAPSGWQSHRAMRVPSLYPVP